MKSFTLTLPALLALAACDGGTQGAETSAEEARAEGNRVGSGVGVAAATVSSAAGSLPELQAVSARAASDTERTVRRTNFSLGRLLAPGDALLSPARLAC